MIPCSCHEEELKLSLLTSLINELNSDFEFQNHAIENTFLTITIEFFDLENVPMNNFTNKFGQEVTNQGGGVATTISWL